MNKSIGHVLKKFIIFVFVKKINQKNNFFFIFVPTIFKISKNANLNPGNRQKNKNRFYRNSLKINAPSELKNLSFNLSLGMLQ
jgi:hypothetical protein